MNGAHKTVVVYESNVPLLECRYLLRDAALVTQES